MAVFSTLMMFKFVKTVEDLGLSRKEGNEKLMDTTESFRVLIVENSTLFRQLFKETFHNRFPSSISKCNTLGFEASAL